MNPGKSNDNSNKEEKNEKSQKEEDKEKPLSPISPEKPKDLVKFQGKTVKKKANILQQFPPLMNL